MILKEKIQISISPELDAYLTQMVDILSDNDQGIEYDIERIIWSLITVAEVKGKKHYEPDQSPLYG